MTGLARLAADGYCVDEWSQWCQGECLTYAVALIRMRADLRFGTAGTLEGTLATIEQDGWRAEHHFAHDDHWVYDAAGMHPREGYAGVNGQFDYVEWDGDAGDWERPDEDLIGAAQDHARRNGIFSGRYGPVSVIVVDSHRARDRLAQLLGYRSPGHYNAENLLGDGNDYHIVPSARLDEVLRIKSIKVRKRPPKLNRRITL